MILTRVKNEIGATAIEYGLIASLVAVVAVTGMSAVGGNLSHTYCTISKHLGGSGTCSGASTGNANGGGSTGGSNSTSGNGGGGGDATGSVNGTNSIADGANIDKINEGLTDELNMSNVPYSLGGNARPMMLGFSYDQLNRHLTDISNWLSEINAQDPITNVFGVYDKSNNFQPITDYSHVNDALQKGGGNITQGNDFLRGGLMQITTASGKVYSISSMGVPTENTKK